MRLRIFFVALTVNLFIAFLFIPQVAFGQEDTLPSTSLAVTTYDQNTALPVYIASQDIDSITFSEYPVNTLISNQYASKGILFGGDSPFISSDQSNPTSPVLSGTPRFRGDITGTFVDPSDGTTPVIVESFILDAGYFDELASTRIEWFDPDGEKLGQRTNTRYGIERFEIAGGNIASWRISIIKTEPAGFAIDNLSFQPVQASVLFRELDTDAIDGTWGLIDKIPGFDHVALQVSNLVYESHPGYGEEGDQIGASNVFTSEDGSESVTVVKYSGAQAQHTKGTFKYDKLPSRDTSPVSDFEEIPISSDLAAGMRDKIRQQIDAGAGFGTVDYSPSGLVATLAPSVQKGGNGNFTCVGLIEWAAEQAGHKGGQGFIRNDFESTPVGIDWPIEITLFEVPYLSPRLMNWSMKSSNAWDDVNQWFQGLFDPVDFMITDPLGRKLGYTEALGEKNEIPYAFYTGNGEVEQFLIPNPVAGRYQVEFVGLGQHILGAMASKFHGKGIDSDLAAGEVLTATIDIEMQAGVPGDVNFDGCVNEADAQDLSVQLNTFPNSPSDPGDIDGNGVIEQLDLDLLSQLIAMRVSCAGPDLVVQRLLVTSNTIQVVIENQGTEPIPAGEGFWVDVYINPENPPTRPNQIWNFLADEGLVWGVDGPVLPLQPGGVITLTVNDSLFWPSLSNFSGLLPIGASVYAQVDSANTNTTYGGVLESHEKAGDLYNNITDPTIVTAADTSAYSFYIPLLRGDTSLVGADVADEQTPSTVALPEGQPQNTLPSRTQIMEN